MPSARCSKHLPPNFLTIMTLVPLHVAAVHMVKADPYNIIHISVPTDEPQVAACWSKRRRSSEVPHDKRKLSVTNRSPGARPKAHSKHQQCQLGSPARLPVQASCRELKAQSSVSQQPPHSAIF
jgi:hypothetical protein